MPGCVFAEAADGASAIRVNWTSAKAGIFEVLHDPYGYASSPDLDIAGFPAATVTWLTDGDRAIPLEQSVNSTAHPGWAIAFQPGRVSADQRSAANVLVELPFALIEKGANCTHNGSLELTIHDDEVADARYRMATETCAYLKFNMSGALDAQFDLADPGAQEVVESWRRNQAARLPVAPVAQLEKDFPGFDLAAFDVLAGEDLSVYGFVVDGRHYRSDCRSRDGNYAFCDEMLLPSYSTAKTVFAALALMRLEKRYPGVSAEYIGDLVPQCAGAGWDDVSIADALDMATGHFRSTEADADEASKEHIGFLYAGSHEERIRFACRHFPRKSAPGRQFVYHSSDTYLAGTAMQAVLDREQPGNDGIYQELVVEPFWQPMNLGMAIRTSLVSMDADQPYTGWGLFYTVDDIARIAAWLGAGASGALSLDRDLLAGGLQQVPGDRGLVAGENLRYNNGFWAYDAGPFLGCDSPAWIPFMSGFGGIAVVLFPNDTVYYYFGDGFEQRWREVALESHKIRSLCQ